ncbi:MAG TPA: hypothetical protein VMW93_06385 [bacterium]|nr:hypothetical protein [bacterium]
MTTALKEQKVLDAAHAYAAACAKFNRERGTANFNALVGKRRELHLAAEALEPGAELNLPEQPLRFRAEGA